MNEPIINPMWIYYAGIAEGVSLLAGVTSMVSGTALLYYFITIKKPSGDSYAWYQEEYRENKRKLATFAILFLISALLAILLPSEKMLLKMYIASQITPETLQEIGTTAESVAVRVTDIIADGVSKVLKAGK